MATVLHLLVPGLLGPWPERNTPGFPLPQAPGLTRLLARAKRSQHAPDMERSVLRLFGIADDPERDPPIAPLTLLGDGGEPGKDWWLRADPVSLQADLHTVLLSSARTLSISSQEAGDLIAEFNRVFTDDGQLHARHPQRWYLRSPTKPALRTHSLAQADGRPLDALLPYGSDAGKWRSWLTEIQMLFHQHAVNQRREQQGQAMINSVWFWGGGTLPTAATAPADTLHASDPLVAGFARLTNHNISDVPATAAAWLETTAADASALIVLETVRHTRADNDPFVWSETVAQLDQDWFAPILRAIRKKQLQQLILYPCNGACYAITPSGLRRFWRFPKALSSYLS